MTRAIRILLGLVLTQFAFAESITRVKSEMVPMRDGVHLSTDVYYVGEQAQARPVVLIRTVYNKNYAFEESAVWRELVLDGYAVVIQDIRGRYESEGVYRVARGRREDGIDTLDWIVTQPWSNGKVGLGGCSYLGEAQVVLEATHHPALVVGLPKSPASGYYRPGRAWQSFSGGVFELGQTAGWFMSNGSRVFYGPNLRGEARRDWFNSDASMHFQSAPSYDFSAYLEIIDTFPVITLLQRANGPNTDYETWRGSHPDGDYFRSMDLVMNHDSTSIPNLFFDTWYDYGARETLMMAEQFRALAQTENASQQHVVIGAGTHCNFAEHDSDVSVGDRPVSNAAYEWQNLEKRWYDYWLKDRGAYPVSAFLTYYVLGLNEWKTAESWPLPNTHRTKWFFSSEGRANTRMGNGRLLVDAPTDNTFDQFEYDPLNPVPSLGGHTCCTGSDTEAGGYDQRVIEERNDVLVYTSESLTEGIEVTGLINAVLYVSSSALDTDFTVKLVDVYPDGSAFNVQEGAFRMSYRNSLRERELIEPGSVYRIEVDLNATSNYFAEGHRIRVEVSSSNFPRFERNLNTGESNANSSHAITATNVLWHGADRASYIELPVIRE